jgi:uncharacterized protein (DUF952 family)
VETANAFFRGLPDLVLLAIDQRIVRAELRYEPAASSGHAGPGDRFPHLYGALNLDAVIGVAEFPPNADGSFELPKSIEALAKAGSAARGRGGPS